ncbi:MAG: hypothetical protein OEY89_01475 [Gammaproteobacteria bacterium]|nr:hypothetical protein [Gammaproteobacteria bacterium]
MNEDMEADDNEIEIEIDSDIDDNDYLRIKHSESLKKRASYEARKKIEERIEELRMRKLTNDYYFDDLMNGA